MQAYFADNVLTCMRQQDRMITVRWDNFVYSIKTGFTYHTLQDILSAWPDYHGDLLRDNVVSASKQSWCCTYA